MNMYKGYFKTTIISDQRNDMAYCGTHVPAIIIITTTIIDYNEKTKGQM